MIEKKISVSSINQYLFLFGPNDKYLDLIKKSFDAKISIFGNEITILAEENDANMCYEFINNLKSLIDKGHKIDRNVISYAIDLVKSNKIEILEELLSEVLIMTSNGRAIKCKTLAQREYIKAIQDNIITICSGPAGTGKTYLAVAQAVNSFRAKQVERIILTRPAVEAGEKLGFLPGDLSQKVDPYLRPLYDALFEFIGSDAFNSYMEKGIIEIAPLAYMRGRTLSNAFIILDEAQNTSIEQMKMFLTRIGSQSKAVVTGDLSQTDLQVGKQSGLCHAMKILQGIEEISIHHLSNRDVVRNHIVRKIIEAYDKFESERS